MRSTHYQTARLCDSRCVTRREDHSAREVHTPRADGVTVYYPFALVELLGCRQVDDHEAGEILLTFEDEDGCQVTIRLRAVVVEALKARLCTPPDSSQELPTVTTGHQP